MLREAAEQGITHIDTSDAYGPLITKQLFREALHPYPESVFIATKVGATRDAEGGWPTARRPEDLRQQVHQNLESLGVETVDLVNMRMGVAAGPGMAAAAFPEHPLISGTSKVAHLRDNIRGAGISMSAQDVAELDALEQNITATVS
ncbi:aldo/keto reductase [Nesterenkonia muleiensis]|uniref:aldo/keto reductase n=1 Tax=Nesterenkonia muleiensis TaxID=2282648 RepID=UPI001EE44868|nr:aldo/keto reductase [Nesterenkonia muleiensis]